MSAYTTFLPSYEEKPYPNAVSTVPEEENASTKQRCLMCVRG
jgi:hypothetical protein